MLSDNQIILISFVLWPTLQFMGSFIANRLPMSFFSGNNRIFKARKWEMDGRFYQKYFNIKAWKEYIPDSSFLYKNIYAKKRLSDFSNDNLNLFLIESRRAELVHLLGIFPFWIWITFSRLEVMLWMLLYALVVNIPCIMLQRYNRPRIVNYINRREALKNGVEND
jgi:glycosyl-4,4'-diaponeurosporenoate acyltransferase